MESNLPQVHICFVHGFLGGADTFGKWRELLYADTELKEFGIQVHVHKYYTRATQFTGFLEKFGKKRKVPAIHTLAEGLTGFINSKKDSEGSSRVIVVGHSMGGIVARWAILEAVRNGEVSPIDLLITLATPHNGGELAQYAKHFSMVSVQAKELDADGPIIQALENEWADSYQLDRVQPMFAFVADQDGVITAPSNESNYNTQVCPRACWETLQADHEEICKPSGLKDPRYVQPRDKMLLWLRTDHAPASADDSGVKPVVTDDIDNQSQKTKTETEQPSKSKIPVDRSKLYRRWQKAVTQCQDARIELPCLMTGGDWLDGAAVIELAKDDEWIDQHYMADFKDAVRECEIGQVGALQSLAGAMVSFLFESRGVGDIDTADVLAFADATRGWSAYYLVDSRIERAVDPISPSSEQGYDLETPNAVEIPETNYLRLDPKEALVELLSSFEKLRVGESDRRNHTPISDSQDLTLSVEQLNQNIRVRNYIDGHILLYGYERERGSMKALKSEKLDRLRMVILPERTPATEFETRTKAICKQTFRLIEERFPGPNQNNVKIQLEKDHIGSGPAQSATANFMVPGHGNNITINNIQVSGAHAELVKIIEEIRVALRELDSDEADQLAREAKTLVEEPDRIPTKMGDFLTTLYKRASESGKLFDLFSKAQKAYEALTSGGIAP